MFRVYLPSLPADIKRPESLALDEGFFDHILPCIRTAALGKALGCEPGDRVGQHGRAAAQHEAVAGGIHRREADVGGELAALERRRDAPCVVASLSS